MTFAQVPFRNYTNNSFTLTLRVSKDDIGMVRTILCHVISGPINYLLISSVLTTFVLGREPTRTTMARGTSLISVTTINPMYRFSSYLPHILQLTPPSTSNCSETASRYRNNTSYYLRRVPSTCIFLRDLSSIE